MAINNIKLHVQSEKVDASRQTIRKLQLQERFSEEYQSYHSSLSAANEYKDHDKFFRVMKSSPRLWNRKFFFIGEREDRVAEASLFAMRIVKEKSNQYGVKTGFYKRSFRTYINEVPFTSEARLQFLEADSVFMMLNTAAYASTAEVNALFYARIQGIIYYAAKRTLRNFPELGVNFGFQDAAIGLNHRYAIPTLIIGPKELVKTGIVRPGSGRKKRRSIRRRIRRSQSRGILG